MPGDGATVLGNRSDLGFAIHILHAPLNDMDVGRLAGGDVLELDPGLLGIGLGGERASGEPMT